jgi:hypothetical protein
VAYLTCPWCHSPQLVGDDAAEYQCFTCYGDIAFFECPHCHFVQTVNKRWAAFTCDKCDKKGDLPRRWGYGSGAMAKRVEGYGHPFPKF